MTFVAASVKPTQSEKPAETDRKVIVEVEDPIFRAEEGSGDPQIQFAEDAVFPLGVTAEKARDQIVFCETFSEVKTGGKPVDAEAVVRTACPSQPVYESAEHFPVGEADAGFHRKTGGSGKASHKKSSQPPVTSCVTDALVFVSAKTEGAVEHFRFIRAGEPGGFVVAFRNHGICVINANFRSGVDTVLPFPKFDQPGSALIIKVDREGVKDHSETGCQIVVKPGVAGLLLGRIHRGGKEPAVTVEIVTEGVYQLI